MNNEFNIGTDILDLNDFPDFHTSNEISFFNDNYTLKEIVRSQRTNATRELARLFSIKESLVKADKTLIKLNFNKIEIELDGSNYFYKDFLITSSIESNLCISFVIKINY